MKQKIRPRSVVESMRTFSYLVVVASALAGSASPARQAAAADDTRPTNNHFVPGADSKTQRGVPEGKSFQFIFDHSKIFPGTSRTITVYVPAQYTADRPACLYVGLDRLGFGAPLVFDNLISKREMPVTIGIGVSPGTLDSAHPGKDPRFNRSVEFDGLNGNLARFLIEELIPELERRKTPDGLPILLSKDPNDHAAGGASTGGVGAFTLAWERPDVFRRVFTAIGTFVGMRGADSYPVLVRKTEPKPIRIFMQDGANDEWRGGPEFGDWWMSNQIMERALKFAGYEVEHAWGEGSHDDVQATAVFPDAMRWLWKDWPQPVTAGQSQNTFLMEILISGEGWQAVPPAQAAPRELLDAQNYHARDALGREYSSDTAAGKVWIHSGRGKRVLIDSGLRSPTGIALSPDGLWLAVAESKTHWGYHYRIEADGTVTEKQRFYWFHVPDDADDSGAGAWVMDRAGRLYAATRYGVQVFDHNGRVRAILPVPSPADVLSIAFSGPGKDVLYVSSRDHKIYRRKMRVSGTTPGAASIDVPIWDAG